MVSELKKLAKNSDAIYLATDLDREGEAIAWHLQEAIGGDTSRYHRVVFNEITQKAIQAAFEAPASSILRVYMRSRHDVSWIALSALRSAHFYGPRWRGGYLRVAFSPLRCD